MTPTEITLSVVHNTAPYETVRLECKYTLDDGDNLAAAFKSARLQLENAFFVAYPEHKPKKTLPELTVKSNGFDRICRALKDGKTDISELQMYFKISTDAMDYFIKYKLV